MDAKTFTMHETKVLADGVGRLVLTICKKLVSLHKSFEILSKSGRVVRGRHGGLGRQSRAWHASMHALLLPAH